MSDTEKEIAYAGQATQETREAVVKSIEQPAQSDFPTGAIENGRAFIDRLETHYSFECEAGPLKNCTDWYELVRRFNYLADYVAALQQQQDGVCSFCREKFARLAALQPEPDIESLQQENERLKEKLKNSHLVRTPV